MSRLACSLARLRRLLADHLDQLRLRLKALTRRLCDDVALAVGEAAAGAVAQAVRAALGVLPVGRPTPDRYGWRSPLPAPRWGEPQDDGWRGGEDTLFDYPEGEPHPEPEAADDDPEPRRSGLVSALTMGCQAVAWWLRRQVSRAPVLVALGVGAASALAAYLRGAVASVGAPLGLVALADAV
jgi:hypothetical protein